MYIDKVLPFLQESDVVRCTDDVLDVSSIFIPFTVPYNEEDKRTSSPVKRTFKVIKVRPLGIYVLNEQDSVAKRVKEGYYGFSINASVMEMDYTPVASTIEISTVDDKRTAVIKINDAYKRVDDISTDILVNSASNGVPVTGEELDKINVPLPETVDLESWMNSFKDTDLSSMVRESKKMIGESADMLDSLLNDEMNGSGLNPKVESEQKDSVYEWLNAYFSLPENVEMENGGREVVPLLIGPTAVFKSATVKELCKKYDYRLVDFRVAFTSRLDFSGLSQIGDIDGGAYSYACPMEEIVTCSDGFREYCKKAYSKVKEIIDRGYIEVNKASNGEETESDKKELTDEQVDRLNQLLDQYKEYMKTPVLFFDEITRCKDAGVEGVLVQLLNQKRFNSMTLNGCKFVAATNLDVINRDARYKESFADIYDVNTDLDVAYSNRFMPLIVRPDDVKDRWFEWAKSSTKKNGKDVTEIHPLVTEFLETHPDMVYNDKPIMDAIDSNKNENEIKAQTFPNYRTWDMLSGYLYSIDNDCEFEKKKDKNAVPVYRDNIINGLVSDWVGKEFMEFLNKKGYKIYKEVNSQKTVDDIGDFLDSTLSAGVPALLVGPSSLGKTSRVKAYMKKVEKKTGLRPVYINVNLSAVDSVDLMGMPTKRSLVQYVSKSDLSDYGLSSVGDELGEVAKEVTSNPEYGMTDKITLRAPDYIIKQRFKKALEEGREVILFFDECNRAKNPTVMSAMFECISDSRYAGVSFKDYKDKVKIVAACNMTSSDMEDMSSGKDSGDYTNASSLDPALAARFAMYWKKKYDVNDYYSWINFMEDQKKEGLIDGTIVSYFKDELTPEEAVEEMAKVERRTLDKAQPSTRTMYQMSKDIKAMRGKSGDNGFKSSLYNGKVIFTRDMRVKLSDLEDNKKSINIQTESFAQNVVNFTDDILEDADVWNSAITDEHVDMGKGKVMSGKDIMDTLKEIRDNIKNMLLKPMSKEERSKCRAYCSVALALESAISKLDGKTSDMRKDFFSMYVGESLALKFQPYFDSKFGSEMDENITIEMLSDIKLIKPFIKQRRVAMSKFGGDTEKMVMEFLDLMKEFLDVHGTTLPSANYAKFIDEFINTVGSDNINTMLKRSTKDVDDMYKMAEGEGDEWILSILRHYSVPFSPEDIQNMRERINGNKVANKSKKKRTRIL